MLIIPEELRQAEPPPSHSITSIVPGDVIMWNGCEYALCIDCDFDYMVCEVDNVVMHDEDECEVAQANIANYTLSEGSYTWGARTDILKAITNRFPDATFVRFDEHYDPENRWWL